jgi:hypothetical protein
VLRWQQFLVPVGELVDFVGRHAAPNCLPLIQNYGVRMPTLRTKSISTKVTKEEYAHFEILAGDQTISEWVRETLLRAVEPSPAELTIVAELLALRMILMNILFTTANREQLTSTAMDDIIKRADAGKLAKAMDRLMSATRGPQRG